MSSVDFSIDPDGIARVVLNNPERHNVLDDEVIGRLAAVASSIASDPKVRVVILSAVGKSFSAGADIAWMGRMLRVDRETRIREARKLAGMLFGWYGIDKPVIARVEGDVYGGALGLVAIADSVVATEDVRFTLSETRLGLIPAVISPYVLARLGNAHAHQVFFSGRVFDAREAMEYGLVTRVADQGSIGGVVKSGISMYLACAPGAVSVGKRLVRNHYGPVTCEEVEMTVEMLADCWESDEAREGIEAFLAGRRPGWRG